MHRPGVSDERINRASQQQDHGEDQRRGGSLTHPQEDPRAVVDMRRVRRSGPAVGAHRESSSMHSGGRRITAPHVSQRLMGDMGSSKGNATLRSIDPTRGVIRGGALGQTGGERGEGEEALSNAKHAVGTNSCNSSTTTHSSVTRSNSSSSSSGSSGSGSDDNHSPDPTRLSEDGSQTGGSPPANSNSTMASSRSRRHHRQAAASPRQAEVRPSEEMVDGGSSSDSSDSCSSDSSRSSSSGSSRNSSEREGSRRMQGGRNLDDEEKAEDLQVHQRQAEEGVSVNDAIGGGRNMESRLREDEVDEDDIAAACALMAQQQSLKKGMVQENSMVQRQRRRGGGGIQEEQEGQRQMNRPALLQAPRSMRLDAGRGLTSVSPSSLVEPMKESWVCPVCLQSFDEPCVLPQCSHNFCKACVQGLARTAMPARDPNNPDPNQRPQAKVHCPLCRVEFIPSDVRTNEPLLKEMKEARVRCINKDCGAVFSPLRSKSHQDECPYGIATCPHQPHGCGFKAPRKELRAHMQLCPYEQIKGLFPRIRQHNDHVTAAMRGWENAFVSQQQMLASHTALLRNMDRRSHRNPLHHLQFAHGLFWEPYLWNNHRERWIRSFSLSMSVMIFYLMPLVLSMLVVATRRDSLQQSENILFHQSTNQSFAYPIIGIDCNSGEQNHCLFGVSPKISWIPLCILLACVSFEAMSDEKWLGTIEFYVPGGGGNLKMSSSLTRGLIELCVAWACYSLGAAPLPYLRYLALGLTLLIPFGLESITPGSKFQRPLIQGLVLGFCLHMVQWWPLFASCLLETWLAHGLSWLCGDQVLRALKSFHVPVGPRLEEYLVSHQHESLAHVIGIGILGVAFALLWSGNPLAYIYCMVLQNALQLIIYLIMIGMDALMAKALRVPRPNGPGRFQDPRCPIMYTRGLFVASIFGYFLLCLL